jgi:hypothetical protein
VVGWWTGGLVAGKGWPGLVDLHAIVKKKELNK